MKNKLLGSYLNGNYVVRLYEDGTKIKDTSDDKFVASFPDSMDVKITNYCDLNCPMCHEMSNTLGKEGDLNSEFFSSLKKGVELAIGGGNPLTHKDLIPFLKRMKDKGIICNLTINERHLLKDKELVNNLIKDKLIYGLGVSLNEINNETIEFAKVNKNTVFHIINGIFTDFDKIANKGLKILILGYKKFGRGKDFFDEVVEKRMEETKKLLPSLLNKFKCISFDNLALEQLEVKNLISEKQWESIYMGDDGEASMYIDLVERKFARSSTSELRYDLEDNIISMFDRVRKCTELS
ncbi:MAG: hypothetical protein IKJ30_00010 [Bacilli bacterium]|nr:hypothetical protein [Bacilli bacterium]